jgi:hypothetical protein
MTKPRFKIYTRLVAEVFFICLLLSYDALIHGVLRWEQSTTQRFVSSVAAHDAKQLDTLFWSRHFAPGTKRVLNRWTTDFGDFPGRASCDNTRPVEMPGSDQKLDFRLWLLGPVIPVIRHRLEVQIGGDGAVINPTYDTYECYFSSTHQSGGSFTNQGLAFHLLIPCPVLLFLAGISWLLAIASRKLWRPNN